MTDQEDVHAEVTGETFRAVLIGFDEYERYPALPAVARNIADLRRALLNPALFGIPSSNITVVRAKNTTALDVARAVRSASEDAVTHGDTLLVYFAGHGVTDGRSPNLYLALPRTDPDAVDASAVSYDQIRLRVREGPPRRIVILDCCLSARAFEAAQGDVRTATAIEGTAVLAACPGDQFAQAPLGETHTAFTSALLSVLNNGIPELGKRSLRVWDVFRTVKEILIARGKPWPEASLYDHAGQIPFGKNRAWHRQVVMASAAGQTSEGQAQAIVPAARSWQVLEAAAERASRMVTAHVQWIDEEVRNIDQVPDDEKWWVLSVTNSSEIPLTSVMVDVSSGDRMETIGFDLVEPGRRRWYILRPPLDFNLNRLPRAVAEFDIHEFRYRLEDGLVRRVSPVRLSLEDEAREAAALVQATVTWIDDEVRRIDKVPSDENWWMLLIYNGSKIPLQRSEVRVKGRNVSKGINFGPVNPGQRRWYILRPPDHIDLTDDTLRAEADFSIFDYRFRMDEGKAEMTGHWKLT
jgi:hypothetical protein